jgi:hypothetical protein
MYDVYSHYKLTGRNYISHDGYAGNERYGNGYNSQHNASFLATV